MNIDLNRFYILRRDLMKAIDKALDDGDGHCKPYEGEFDLTLTFPSFFEDDSLLAAPKLCTIELHCYLLGPHRHYVWSGTTFGEALTEAEQEIRSWMGGETDAETELET